MPPGVPSSPIDSTAHAVNLLSIEDLKREGFSLVMDIGMKLLVAVLILFIGFWITRRVLKMIRKMMERRDIDLSLRSFITGFVGVVLRALVLIVAVSTAGVHMTSIIAVLGSIGLAIGLALQGSLANFAGGVVILVLKPFRVGERIEANGVTGQVKEINVFNTTLVTIDNRTIYIPNGPLAGGTIINYSRAQIRRVDCKVGIAYSQNIATARQAILEQIGHETRICNEPAPFVGLNAFADSSLELTIMVWSAADDYWDVYFWLNEEVKKALDTHGISIPFPQREVRLLPSSENPGSL